VEKREQVGGCVERDGRILQGAFQRVSIAANSAISFADHYTGI
jgi:hypothetical protein